MESSEVNRYQQGNREENFRNMKGSEFEKKGSQFGGNSAFQQSGVKGDFGNIPTESQNLKYF